MSKDLDNDIPDNTADIYSASKKKLYKRFVVIFLTMGLLIYLTTATIGAFRFYHSVVGVMEDVPFAEHEFELHPGDTLFVYTDGVPEATNTEDVQYSTDRMLALLNKYKDVPINELLIKLRNDIDKFVGDAPQFDDITMLSIKYKGGQPQ